DCEAKMLSLQYQNEALTKSKELEVKNEFQALTKRLNTIENDKITAENQYQNENMLLTGLTYQQQKQSNDTYTDRTKHLKKDHHRRSQHSNGSICFQCDALQRNYELELQYRLSIEKDNERLREAFHKQQQHSVPSSIVTTTQAKQDNVYLTTTENSKSIHGETERAKYDLDRIQDINLLIDNYDRKRATHTLHQPIDTTRKFYDQEGRQRQLTIEKLTNDSSRPRTPSSFPVGSHLNGGGDYEYHHHLHSHDSHENSRPSSQCSCTNSELLKERLETAIDTSLADERMQAIKQLPLRSTTTNTTMTNGIGNILTLSADDSRNNGKYDLAMLPDEYKHLTKNLIFTRDAASDEKAYCCKNWQMINNDEIHTKVQAVHTPTAHVVTIGYQDCNGVLNPTMPTVPPPPRTPRSTSPSPPRSTTNRPGRSTTQCMFTAVNKTEYFLATKYSIITYLVPNSHKYCAPEDYGCCPTYVLLNDNCIPESEVAGLEFLIQLGLIGVGKK
ncbi:unnamed protein product, partial [Didymodactylos carnosus]